LYHIRALSTPHSFPTRRSSDLAALLLVERDFADKSDRMTYQQIGDEVGFTRKTIHEWNSRDRNFIEYKNYLAADFFDAYLPMVYSKMIEGISNGSMKGIELYL